MSFWHVPISDIDATKEADNRSDICINILSVHLQQHVHVFISACGGTLLGFLLCNPDN